MSRFTDELKVIPRTARLIAALVWVLATAGFFLLVTQGHDRDLVNAPGAMRVFVMVFPPLVVTIYALLIGYVYADAKRRGMRYVMWTLLAVFIPDGIGIILYFVLRDPPMRACPGCAQLVKSGFTFCPHCGTSLLPTCPNCGRGVELGWSNCPHCGTKLPSAAPQVRTA
jgi:RNA polymerase subunit RPABC4/transcription elongation factor Spt4